MFQKDVDVKYLLPALLLLPGLAMADDAPKPPDYSQTVLSQRLTVEINNSMQMQAALMAARDEIARLNAEIEKLKSAAPSPEKR
jgi:hypothetical protein